MKLLPLLALALSACTLPQVAYNPASGEFVSSGGSFGTKSTYEQGYARTASGTVLAHSIYGKDETVLGKAYFWEKGITAVSGNILNGFRAAQSTDRIISGHGVQRAGIEAARDVRLAEIAVPPEVPVVPVAIP